MTRKRVVNHAGAAWLAAVGGAWLVAAACRTIQAGPAAGAAGSGLRGALAARALPGSTIRVGILVEVEEARVAAGGGVEVRGRAPGESGVLLRSLPRATFVPGASKGLVRLVETGDELEQAALAPSGAGELLEADGDPYRGLLEVRPTEAGLLTVVNTVELEDYLRGVVPNELSPAAFPSREALRAQAVAARSWALAHLGDYASKGYDVCATPACQVYRGRSSELPQTDRAVEETRGVVATWRGRPINAYYTSTCGGHTEDGEAIFDDGAPYLRGVACPAEAPSNPAGWEVRLTPAQVARGIERYGSVGEVRDIVPRRLGVSGRVVELGVVGSEGELELKGLRVRWGLGLRENLFVVGRETGPGGDVERFVITGRGWGHGVGLCQVGAYGMAQSGSTYEEILKHYYTGIRLTPVS